MPEGGDLERLRDDLIRFRAERDWEQFHTPRNLAASVVIEAAELLEHFQWHREGEALSEEQKTEVAKELADVFIYLLLLSHDLGVDLVSAAMAKVRENARRFPVEEAKGRAWSNKPGRERSDR
jgi:NTP pyrophosphatase (non-canonical NTP hydrolase)